MVSSSLFFGVATVAATTIVSLTLGQTVNENDVTTKYFISQFNGNEFPIVVDTCLPLSVVPTDPYQKATCSDDGTYVTWEYFLNSDSTCTSAISSLTTIFNSTYQNGLGRYGDFNCDATNSYYASVDFSTTDCDSDPTYVTMDAPVGVCAFVGLYQYSDDPSEWTGIELYCEENWVELQYYDIDSLSTLTVTCDDSLLTSIANATETCGFMLQTDGTKVYGLIQDCVLPADDDSASQVSIMAGLLIVAVITLFI